MDGEAGRMFVVTAGPDRLPAGSIGYWTREWLGQTVWEAGWSVLPEYQGQGVATQATRAVVALARSAAPGREIHAFPGVDNGPSNGVCRGSGFRLRGAFDFEYPPGHPMRCNDWVLEPEPG